MDFEPPPSSLPGSPEQDPQGPDFILEGTEPAWERKEELGFVQAYTETLKQVLLNPAETFERLFIGGGFVNPLIFLVISAVAVAIVSFFVNLVFGGLIDAMTAGMASSTGGAASSLPIQTIIRGGSGIAGIVIIPISAVVVAFIMAGVYHLILMMVGGATQSYEATFRVVTYASGATMLLQIIPICGPMAGVIWSLVCVIIGLSRVHQTDTWKAVVAVLAPSVICCLAIGGVFVVAIMAGAAAAAGHASP